MKRRFDRKQKEALYWLAGGKCQNCGAPLPNDWHADHLRPYAHGGRTDVVNGQALCPNCNCRKGAQLMLAWPFNLALRPWQQEFLDKYNAAELKDFLLVATPGAGKTVASLKAGHDLLNSGVVQRIVVVCPTDHLRTQWLEDATKVNIHLDKIQLGWSGQIAQTTDYIGMVTTYAQVVSKQEHLRAYTDRFRTLVILDEIHHCGDEEHKAWGQSIKHAFDLATRRLLLSGTPFRSDNNPIPFVRYETAPNNPAVRVSFADHSYGYGDALKDENVVRHVVFPTYDGHYIWEHCGEKKEATFKDRLDRADSGHRLRTALHPEGDWIKKVIKAADDRLNTIRREEGYSIAGGLIVAQDQWHAKEYARVLKDVTGEECTLAISDTDDASKAISKFRQSNQKWIVAVKMVSEGVDIKRIRVGVYATNVLTTTFFRQVIGRAIRWDNDPRWEQLDDQTAWFYLPEDPQLVRLAEEIKVEITDTIRQQEIRDSQQERNNVPTSPELMQLLFDIYEFKHSDGEESDHIFSGEKFTLEELANAERRFAFPGFERVPSAAKAFAWRRMKQEIEYEPQIHDMTPARTPSQPKYAQKEQLKSTVRRKVARLVHVCQQQGIRFSDTNPYQAINFAWGRKREYSRESTNNGFEDKLTWLEGLIRRALQGDRSIAEELRR
ncbi:MAG: DEAD/DEAH box helicase family protein [Pyrinomonadaceae bacterium]